MNIDLIYYYGFPATTIFLLIVILYLQFSKQKYQEDITKNYDEIQTKFAENADVIFKKTISDFQDLFLQVENKISNDLENSDCIKKIQDMHNEINTIDIEIKNLNHHLEKFTLHNRHIVETFVKKDKMIQELEAVLSRRNKEIERLKNEVQNR